MCSTPWSASALMTISAPVFCIAIEGTPRLTARARAGGGPHAKRNSLRGQRLTFNECKVITLKTYHLLRIERSPRNHLSSQPCELAFGVLSRLGLGGCACCLERQAACQMCRNRCHAQRAHDGKLTGKPEREQRLHLLD